MTPLELIPLADAKTYLKVDFTDEDTYIESLVKAAIEEIENATEQRLYDRSEVIETSKQTFVTPIYPINSITSIFQGGVELVEDTDYEVSGDWDKVFEFEDCENEEPKVITLDVGHTAGTCPESLKLACYNLIEYWFNNRGASDVPANVLSRISKYRRLTWI